MSANDAILPVPTPIICEGVYSAHLQGIAVDEAHAIYWSFTRDLVKTDPQGKTICRAPVPSHHGDLAYYDGKVYVAVNLGRFNQEAGQADSWVYVYDAGDLSLLEKREAQEAAHGAGGIACHGGRFIVVGGLPEGYKENYAYEYDASLNFIERHDIESGYTRLGIQTACHTDGFWWFGCYGQALLKTDEAFQMIARYDFDCAIGLAPSCHGGFLIGECFGSHRGRAFMAHAEEDLGLVLDG